MLNACDGSPLEGAGECVGNISTISQEMEAALRLPRTLGRPMMGRWANGRWQLCGGDGLCDERAMTNTHNAKLGSLDVFPQPEMLALRAHHRIACTQTSGVAGMIVRSSTKV